MNKINPEIHDFSMEKVRESHGHVCFEKPVDETVSDYENNLRHFNCESILLASIPATYSITHNYVCAYCKEKLSPKIFASAGLEYHFDERDTPEYFENQIREYHQMGFDGIKMLEAKVSVYRYTKRLPDHPDYNKFFAYAEKNNFPILMHVGDPPSFWDLSKASAYTISRGWVYTEEDPSLEELRQSTEKVLEKFPKLTLILAHFFFMSDDLDRAGKLLDKYENLYFDITPGGIMFVNFSKDIEKARDFFEKYSHRILYGTDMYNAFESPEKAEAQVVGPRVFQARSFIEKTEAYDSPLISAVPLTPACLSKETQDKIYRDNFVKIYGDKPKKLKADLILKAIDKVKTKAKFSDLDIENTKIIEKYFNLKNGVSRG